MQRLGVRVVAVSVDARDALAEFQEALGSGITLIADPTAQATNAFGMLDADPVPDRVQARAGMFWIGTDGVVKRRWLTDNYRKRPSVEEILAAMR